MSNTPVCLGIDLGTGNSSIAYVVDDPRLHDSKLIRVETAELPADDSGHRARRLPSVLAKPLQGERRPAFGSEFFNRFFGARRKQSLLRHGKDLFISVKSDLGQLRTYPYSDIEGCSTPADVAGMLIRRLIEAVEEKLPTVPIDEAFVAISVPASASETVREETTEAALQAGIDPERLHLIDEPVAALVDLLNDPTAALAIEPGAPRNLLVFDYGAGTCDLALITVERDATAASGLRVTNRAISPYRRLGGDDLDRAIMKEIVWPQLADRYGLKEWPALSPSLRRKIEDTFTVTVARRLKEKVSDRAASLLREHPESWLLHLHTINEQVPCESSFAIDGATKRPRGVRFTMTGSDLLGIMRPYLARPSGELDDVDDDRSLLGLVMETLKRGHVSPLDLHALILHGGSCRNPFIKVLFQDAFNREDSLFVNTRILMTPDLETSVARGAAISCYLDQIRKMPLIEPILAEDLGILARDDKSVTLVRRGVPLPFPVDGGVHSVDEEFFVGRDGQRELLVPYFSMDERRLGGSVKVRLPADVRQGAVVRIKLQITQDKRLRWWFSVDSGSDIEAEAVRSPWTQRLLTGEEQRLLRYRQEMRQQLDEEGVVPPAWLRHEPIWLSRAGHIDEARLACEDYLAFFGEDASILNAMGLIFGDLGWREQECDAHMRAARLHPQNAIFRGNWGCALARSGEFEKARTCLRQALRLDDTLAYVWAELGDVYEELDEPERAQKAYKRSIQLTRPKTGSPTEALQAWGRLARLYRAIDEDEKADEAAAMFHKLQRDDRVGGDSRDLIISKDSGLFRSVME